MLRDIDRNIDFNFIYDEVNGLYSEIAKYRELHGKKPLQSKDHDDNQPPKTPDAKNISQSKTDPECGLLHKGEHGKQFAYAANTACDKHLFVYSMNGRTAFARSYCRGG